MSNEIKRDKCVTTTSIYNQNHQPRDRKIKRLNRLQIEIAVNTWNSLFGVWIRIATSGKTIGSFRSCIYKQRIWLENFNALGNQVSVSNETQSLNYELKEFTVTIVYHAN